MNTVLDDIAAPVAASAPAEDAEVPEGFADAADADGSGSATPRSSLNAGMYRHLPTPTSKSAEAAPATPAGGRGKKRRREAAAGGAAGSGAGAGSGGGRPGGALGEPTPRPTVRYADLGGIEAVMGAVRDLVEYPLTHPELYRHMGVTPPVGVLLHGPAGCGKTTLAHAIAGELGVHFRAVSAPEVISGMSGESEETLRALFRDASEHAPALLFLDELDAIAPKRADSARGMEKRVVAQLLSCLDGLAAGGGGVVVLGATSRPDALDASLRRAGRFDREVCMGIPDEAARGAILTTVLAGMRLHSDVSIPALARRTPGYVGADLASLAKEAAIAAVNRAFEQLFPQRQGGGSGSPQQGPSFPWRTSEPLDAAALGDIAVTPGDMDSALAAVQPSAMREGFTTIPDVAWADVGALGDVRAELQMCIVQPIQHPEHFASLGIAAPAGVLLFGPPGCGKTLLAKAVAHESHANFISIKGPELLDKYVGESERAVRSVFTRARASAPCVVFFDELDALAPRRGAGADGGSGVSERVVNQLLTELDGMGGRNSVFVVGATNRPDMIDSAMLRPGRLDKLLYVPLPTPAQRADILSKAARRTPLAPGVDLASIAASSACDGYSGADLAALVREASMACLRERYSAAPGQAEALLVSTQHFITAAGRVRGSVSPAERRAFDAMARKIKSTVADEAAAKRPKGPDGGAEPSTEPAAAQ